MSLVCGNFIKTNIIVFFTAVSYSLPCITYLPEAAMLVDTISGTVIKCKIDTGL
jgi:hypothetical protein